MAFQPVVDIEEDCRPYAYEALVRGTDGSSAADVLSSVPSEKSLEFDAICRNLALDTAHMLGLRGRLSLNISPSALCSVRHGIQSTLKAAKRVGFPADRLIFEVTEHEPLVETLRLRRWLAICRNRGVRIALDDFGTGYSGLNTVLQIKPDIVKIDRAIVNRIDRDPSKQALVKGVVSACNGIGISVVAEGVESEAEANALRSYGIRYMQGYLFGRPTVGQVPRSTKARAFA
jgi:EAL domain-containing protein (putative c-di-GMP-specific phosphodiesterase class I)